MPMLQIDGQDIAEIRDELSDDVLRRLVKVKAQVSGFELRLNLRSHNYSSQDDVAPVWRTPNESGEATLQLVWIA